MMQEHSLRRVPFVATPHSALFLRREQAPVLTSFKHDFELIPQRASTVIIDYRNSAIGSGSCGPALKESLRISEKEFDFEFSVKPEVMGNKIPEIEYSALTK